MVINILSRILREAFPEKAIPDLDNFYETYLRRWADIYAGRPPWRSAKKSGLHSRGERVISQMNAAKAICEEFTALTFSEQCDIRLSDEKAQGYINKTLEKTGFWEQIQGFLTACYALGGGCIKVYVADGEPCADFITADKMYPVAWQSGEIREIVFCSQEAANGSFVTNIEKYRAGESQNLSFLSDSRYTLGRRTESAVPEIVTGETAGLFAVFKPAAANNFDLDSPLGVSVYASAIDTLKALDIAFDSFTREFILGKKRIIVPAASIQTVIDPETGNMTRYFDADDEAFVALKTDDAETLKITDNTVELRVNEHVTAIESLYKMLCFQTGVSAATFSLSNGLHYYTKTASEVMSQNAKSARTIRLNQNNLKETLKKTVRSLLKTGVYLGQIEDSGCDIDIIWRDNIITADAATN